MPTANCQLQIARVELPVPPLPPTSPRFSFFHLQSLLKADADNASYD